MPAHQPEEIHELFVQALNAGDVDAVLVLYEPDASLVSRSGQVIKGHADLRAGFAPYLAKQPHFTLQARKVVRADDLALLYSRWHIRETEPSGKLLEYEVNPTPVARRQADGAWLIVLDNTMGAGI